jgi:hypothetical protein
MNENGQRSENNQSNAHKYLRPLFRLIEDGKIDSSFVIAQYLMSNSRVTEKHDTRGLEMKPELS